MHLHFLGGARQVTGSKFWLQTNSANVLVDCGMHQGIDHMRVQRPTDFDLEPAEIDVILLTHAHIDHSGLLPRVSKLGFRGDIVTTTATADLCEIMLLDSAHIQKEDAEFDLKQWKKKGRVGPPPQPLYTPEDAEASLENFQPVSYDEKIDVTDDLTVRFRDAGHILGSASIEVWITERGQRRKIVFSGDLGDPGRPILRDPDPPQGADFVIVESTYGDNLHEPYDETVSKLEATIRRTYERGGHVIIPAFAVGRTQQIMFEISDFVRDGDIQQAPVFVDSPMAIEATEVFKRHPECFDDEMNALIHGGESPFQFPGLKITRSREESMRINDIDSPCVIVSASGMCTGGRIRHHLRHHLHHENDTLLFVGYQAVGTLGRRIVQGDRYVELFPDEEHEVECDVEMVDGFSAHADRQGLLNWLIEAADGANAVFAAHGEEDTIEAYCDTIANDLGLPVCAPEVFDNYDLLDENAIAARCKR